jgi:hypothetical protein
MTEKIREIVDQFLKDHSSCGTYKYRLNSSYWVKFQPTMRTDTIRVYLYSELPGYEFCRSVVYKMGYGPLNDDNEGLSILIEMIYREIEKMNSDSISIGYDLYKSVLADNDKLREEIKVLEHQVKTWKTMSESNNSNFNFAMNSGAKTFQELLQEKREHTKTKDLLEKEKRDHIETQARIVFAQHILSKNREEIVREFWDANREYIDDYGI